MEERTQERKIVPPYLPYRTFRGFIEDLRVGLPGRIDRSLMKSYSGTAQAQLITALRYLDLIQADGMPTDKLARLVTVEGPERQAALRGVLTAAYPFLFNGFALERATSSQLDEQFKKAGTSGDTVRKCVAFFTAAAKDAAIPLSPHIKPLRAARAAGPRPRRSAAPVGSGGGANRTPEARISSGSSRGADAGWKAVLLEKFPSFDPSWSDDVRTRWFESFQDLMKLMQEAEATEQVDEDIDGDDEDDVASAGPR